MPLVVAIEDISPDKVIHNRGNNPDKPSADVFPFFWSGRDNMNDPSAFLVRYERGTASSAHFHAADQVQIVTEGKGMLGHHEYGAYAVHFARAYTPYGPLVPDAEEGWAFVTLRTRADPDGAQRLTSTAVREKLAKVPNRRPWQTSRMARFDGPAGAPVVSNPIEGLVNEEGLFGVALKLQPGAKTTTPDASGGDGQYLVAVKGSFIHAGKEYKAMSVVFMRPNEGPFQVEAGPEGLEALVINFPHVGAADHAVHPGDGTHASWHCNMCGYVYDESAGDPSEGFAAGTRWEDIPSDWTCPDCGVGKQDFEKVEF